MLETTDMTVFIAVVTAFTMLFHASETNCTIGARNAVTAWTIWFQMSLMVCTIGARNAVTDATIWFQTSVTICTRPFQAFVKNSTTGVIRATMPS